MERPFRPRRSMLYTPGTRPERIEKALTMDHGPDMVVADLEDAVAPDEKAGARKAVLDVVKRVRRSRAERCIRVNAIGTPWHDEDVAHAVSARPDALVLPKLESPEDLVDLDHILAELEDDHSVPRSSIALHAQLENAEGIMAAFAIACAARELPRVASFIFGAEDYAASVGARRTRSSAEVLMARSVVVAASAIAGVAAIDQVFIDYKDAPRLAEDCRAGRDLGYTGKQIIHPDQIAAAHAAFTPSADEVREARELLAAVEKAGIGDGGTMGYKGRMIDRPVVAQARRVAAMAEALKL